MTVFIICLTLSLLLLSPAEALAWGVGAHLHIGSRLLQNLSVFSQELRYLLQAFPHDFLYGCISADITLGKKFTHYLEHCHSWRMGKKLLEAARNERQRSCAYGYLSHLGADTVAHCYLVPYKMVRTFNTVLLKHTYWEVRFEALVDAKAWDLARTLAREDFRHNDALMREVLSDTIFSFNTNKRLFNSMLLLSRLQQWQKMLRSLSQTSKWTLEKKDREEYLGLAREASQSILVDMEESPYWQADPSGERAINAARSIRRNLNLLWLDGKLPDREAEAILQEVRLRFRRGITDPDQVLELLGGF